VLSESKRKVGKVVECKDEKEFEERYVEWAGTPIQDTGDFFYKHRVDGLELFIDPTTGEAILPEFRLVKCRCGRKLKIWLGSKNPPVWAGRCPRCKGGHYIGDVDAIEKADRRQKREWLRKAKQMKKKGRL